MLVGKQGLLERNLDLEHASYFVSRITITPTDAAPLRAWRKQLFIVMAYYDGETLRFFMLRTHYRSPFNFADSLLDEARSALRESLPGPSSKWAIASEYRSEASARQSRLMS